MKKVFILFLTLILVACSNTNKGDNTLVDNIKITPEDMYTSILLDDAASVELFLDNGFPIDTADIEGETLVIKAVKSNSLEVLELLVQRKASLSRGTYPYIRKNTNIEVPGKTPLYFVKSQEGLEILIAGGADMNYVNSQGEPLIIDYIKYKPTSYLKILVESGVRVDVADIDLWSPLIWSAVNNQKESVKSLIGAGADLNFRDVRGNYALYYAYNKDVISLLINKNYDLSLRNKDGENIIGEVYLKCVANGYVEEVERLLDIGVDVNYMSYGDTAMSLANENKDANMIFLLEGRGAIN